MRSDQRIKLAVLEGFGVENIREGTQTCEASDRQSKIDRVLIRLVRSVSCVQFLMWNVGGWRSVALIVVAVIVLVAQRFGLNVWIVLEL